MSNELKYRWKPQVEEETSAGIREVDLLTRHFSHRKLFITGEVNDEMANELVSEMLYLVDKNEPIDIYINSAGGAVEAGLVIYDVIQACSKKVEINMYCVGKAYSMAAVLLASGPKGHRFIMPHSRVMIHEVRTNAGFGGTVSDISEQARSIKEVNDTIAKILSKHTGKTVQQILEQTSFDNFMNAEEAIEFKLVDEVKEIFPSTSA